MNRKHLTPKTKGKKIMKTTEVLSFKGSCNAFLDAGTSQVNLTEYGSHLASFSFDELEQMYFKASELKANLDCQKISSVSDQIKDSVLGIIKGNQS